MNIIIIGFFALSGYRYHINTMITGGVDRVIYQYPMHGVCLILKVYACRWQIKTIILSVGKTVPLSL